VDDLTRPQGPAASPTVVDRHLPVMP
jgi:hypothetical protein